MESWPDDIVGSVQDKREIGDDPTVLKSIVKNDRIAKVIRVAQVSEMTLAHESIESEGGYLEPVGFAENTDRSVNCLDVVGGTDIAVRIGRAARAPVQAIEAFKDIEWCGCRCANPRRNGRNRGLVIIR